MTHTLMTTDELYSRLGTVETKLDYLIQHNLDNRVTDKELDRRIDELEKKGAWVGGGLAVFVSIVGVFTWSIQQVNSYETQKTLNNEARIYKLCQLARQTVPTICDVRNE